MAESTPTSSTTLNSDRKVRHLVLDTGALIKGQGYSLARMAEHFWTIPEVIAEVRDPRARFHLDTLPFELRTREPTLQACKAVADFARQTGDYSALSKVDLRVLALTYTLEEEHGGDLGHLRKTTVTRIAIMANDKAPETKKEGEDKEEEEGAKNDGEREAEGEAGDERVYVEVADEDSSDEEDEGGEDETEVESKSEGEEESNEAALITTTTTTTPPPPPPTTTTTTTTTMAAASIPAATTCPPPSADSSSSNSSSTIKPCFSWANAVKATASKPPPPANAVAARRQKEAETEGTPAIPLAIEKLSLSEKEDRFVGNPLTTTRANGGEATSRFLGGAGREAATQGHGGGGQEEEDDGEGWINVENIKAVRAKGTESLFGARKGDGYTGASLGVGGGEGGVVPPPPVVACVTTDFGMQNVLLQMGLRLLSIDGVAVTRVKQWARRCESCAKIVHDQERMFCPRCGNAYLSRVSISVDSETGQLRVHLSKLWRPRRGCKYSIPKAPKGKTGRWEGDMLLREDQLQMGIWQQKVKRRTKALTSMFGADITETLGVAVSKTAAADGIQYGYGRKNPNSQRGRERRGKKKKNKS